MRGNMAMIDHLLFALKIVSAFGCALIAGVFFAFSTFVMSALARLQPAMGIAAMQSINIKAIMLLLALRPRHSVLLRSFRS
jgi:uncharacterized membrane protein